MHSKSCYALFLLALVACQAAPSHKIIENKSIKETELAKEDLKPEDTGVDKDRAKKSTTFCVEVRSGKEELVPCKQEAKQPAANVKTPEYLKPIVQTVVQPAPLQYQQPEQYPVSNFLVQQPIPQPSPSIMHLQQPSVYIQPQFVPVQSQQSVIAPQPVPQSTAQQFIRVQSQPQHTSVVESAPVLQVQSQQPAAAPAPAPTPIINIIPAAPSAPCEKPSVEQPKPIQPPQPPQQIHTFHHVVQPPQQPAPQSHVIQHEVKPIRVEQERRPQSVPIPHQTIGVVPFARPSYTSETIYAPSSPVELIYREEEPTRIVEYVPAVPQESYECSCRSEQQSLKSSKPSKHHVMLYPSSGSHRSSQMMAVQYNPNVVGSEDTSPLFFAAQAREAGGKHHHKKKLPVHLPCQAQGQNGAEYSNNPPNYPPDSYHPATYNINPYTFSYPYGTSSGSYPATNYDSNSKDNSPYNNVPLISVNQGPFYGRNSQDKNSQEFATDNKSTQGTLSKVNLSSNQKREATSIQLKNDEQKETIEGLPMEKENNIM